MSDFPSPSARALLRHHAWVRALARRLAADPSLAEDVSQEACVAALERELGGTPPGGATRRWLGGVVRNLLRQERRGGARRAAREECAARPEEVASTFDVVARASTQRALVEAVLALDEPYRTTVLLRFFDELPQREIARRQGTTAATVNSRLTRGLAKLRERLDREHGGDGTSWLAALAPLLPAGWSPPPAVPPAAGSPPPTASVPVPPAAAPLASPASTVTLGALIVNAKVLACLLAVVVLGVLGAVLSRPDRGAPPEPPAAPAAPVTTAAGGGSAGGAASGLRPEARGAERAPAAARAGGTGSAPPAASAAAPALVRGRVVDVEGRSVPRLALRYGPAGTAPSAEASALESGPAGAFEVEVSGVGGRVVADDPRWTTVMSAQCAPPEAPGADVEPIVVVAPRTAVHGTVTDAAGRPLAGAAVEVAYPAVLAVERAERLDRSSLRRFRVRTDADGAFAWPEAPWVEGARLVAALDGYETWSEPLLAVPEQRLDPVLRRPATSASALIGRVLDPAARPVEGAWVALGHVSTVTDERGAFQLDRARAADGATLRAVAGGHRPAELAEPEDGWPGFVELFLGGPPLAIAGRVVDEGGAPRAGVRVWIDDPTPFTLVGEAPSHVEHLLSGSQTRADYNNFTVAGPGPVGSGPGGTAPVGPPTAWSLAVSDADGRFEIDGLDDREYRLAAMDPDTLLRAAPVEARAGARGVEVVLPAAAVHPLVRGRVVSLAGAPQPGVRVGLAREVFAASVTEGPSTLTASSIASLPATTTDADGVFTFRDVPADGGIGLFAYGDRVLPRQLRLAAAADVTGLELELPLRLHLAVELAEPGRATGFQVLDGRGQVLPVHVLRADSQDHFGSAPLGADGRSEVLVVSEEARSLRLLRDGEVVETVPVQLAPGDVNVLRL